MADKQNKLTIKQEKYVQGLFAGLSQREAYKQAYNCSTWTNNAIDAEACKLANNTKVLQRLTALKDKLASKNTVTVENILAELAKVAFANGSDYAKVVEKTMPKPITDEEGNILYMEQIPYTTVDVIPTDQLDKNKLAAIAGIRQTKDGIEIKQADKLKALELMGKYLGMFTDRIIAENTNVNIEVPGDTTQEQIAHLLGKASVEQLESMGLKKIDK